MKGKQFGTIFREIEACFILDPCGTRSMAAVLDIPQYVAYQKCVAYALSNLTLLTDTAQ